MRRTTAGEDAVRRPDTQAELRDATGLVPVHSDRAHATVKSHGFGFPPQIKAVYTTLQSIKCATALRLRQQCAFLS